MELELQTELPELKKARKKTEAISTPMVVKKVREFLGSRNYFLEVKISNGKLRLSQELTIKRLQEKGNFAYKMTDASLGKLPADLIVVDNTETFDYIVARYYKKDKKIVLESKLHCWTKTIAV